MKRYTALEKDYEGDLTEITLVGWDLKTGEKEAVIIIEEELLPDDEKCLIRNITKKEMAYSCSRYECGIDAHDEGFSYYINYHKNWKRGLGKCTIFSIDWDKTKRDALEVDSE